MLNGLGMNKLSKKKNMMAIELSPIEGR